MRILVSRWLQLTSGVILIFVLGGVTGGLHVVTGMAVGIAVGVVLVLSYRYFRRRLNR
jgi:hypothetical protein